MMIRPEETQGAERAASAGRAEETARLVILLDDLPLQREGMVTLVRSLCSDIQVLGMGSPDGMKSLTRSPDLIVLNVGVADRALAPIAAQRKALPASCARTPILLIASAFSMRNGLDAMKAGYAGLLPNTHTGRTLSLAIRLLLESEPLCLLNPGDAADV